MSRTEGPVEIEVSAADASQRLDQFLAGRFPELSRSYVQTLIDDGLVKVDGTVCRRSQRLRLGELVELVIPETRPLDIVAQDIPIEIVHEDEDLAIVNKPAGMVAHPNTNDLDGTLVNALLFHLRSLSSINGVERPGLVHRIDKDTTGLLVIAKNDHTHRHLGEQFRAHSIERTYAWLCWGCPSPKSGTVEGFISRDRKDRKKMTGRFDSGKHAVTHYEVLEEYGAVSLGRCDLETGRTHQIRVHLSEMHHPILGDPVYGGIKESLLPHDPTLRALIAPVRGQLLHAASLGFVHPRSGQFVLFKTPLHETFARVLRGLRAYADLDLDAPGPWTP